MPAQYSPAIPPLQSMFFCQLKQHKNLTKKVSLFIFFRKPYNNTENDFINFVFEIFI